MNALNHPVAILLLFVASLTLHAEPDKPETTRSLAAQEAYDRGVKYADVGKLDDAVSAFSEASKLAQDAGDVETAAQGTAALIRIQATQQKHKTVAEHFDEFTKNHPGHELEAEVIASAAASLIKLGRGVEALERIAGKIVALGKQPGADLEKAIHVYAMSYLQVHDGADGAEKLIKRLEEWQMEKELPLGVKVWLLMTRIDVLEDKEYFEKPPRAKIDGAFATLLKYDRKLIPDYPLARAIIYLDERGKGADAIPLANEILSRKESRQRDAALYVKSVTLAKSAVPADQKKALDGFSEIIDQMESPNFIEDSLHALGMLQIKRKEWPAAEKTFLRYLKDRRFNKHSPEIWFNLGVARDGQKKFIGKESAATAYARNWSKGAGHFEFSCPAINRTIEIERDHGSKQNAYDLADRWLGAMAKHTQHAIAGPHLRKTAALRDQLANDPSVTPKN